MKRAALALLLAACGGKAPGPAPDPTSGPNAELVARCNACHADVAQHWANGPSHALLLDCASCHTQFLARPGPKHQTSRACGDCHSVLNHSAFDCPVCHEVHGSTNRFLVRETVQDKPVHFTAPEGASADGLVRFGVAGQTAGTGICELCHLGTKYYRSTGDGQAHDTAWCITCHSHEKGFAPSP